MDNGCNYKLLKVLNPWLKSKSLTVPAGKIYYIELPKYKIVATDLADKLINDTIEVNNTHIAVGAE